MVTGESAASLPDEEGWVRVPWGTCPHPDELLTLVAYDHARTTERWVCECGSYVHFRGGERVVIPELSEDAAARNTDGICVVCKAPPGDPHDQRRHDSWYAAEDLTW